MASAAEQNIIEGSNSLSSPHWSFRDEKICLYCLGQSSPHELAFGVMLDPKSIFFGMPGVLTVEFPHQSFRVEKPLFLFIIGMESRCSKKKRYGVS